MVKLGLLLDPSPLGHPLGSPLVSCQGAVGAPGHPYGMLRSWVGVLSPSWCRCWGWSSPISPTQAEPARTPTSTSAGETPFLGLLLGWRRTVWAARAVCHSWDPLLQDGQSQLQGTPGSSWELPSLPAAVSSAELHPLHPLRRFRRVTGRTPGTLWGPFSASPAPAAPVPPREHPHPAHLGPAGKAPVTESSPLLRGRSHLAAL